MKAVILHMLFGFLCLLLNNVQISNAQAAETQAVEKITISLEFIPNIEDGKSTFGICARCHLPEAWGNDDGTYPQLAGQHVNVLMKQLLDIRNGTRHSSLMFPFVQQRTVGGYQELSNVVAYISTLPMNPSHAKGPWRKNNKKYKQGKTIYQQNCSGCHGQNGEGNNELTYPKLQGQHFQYMNQQLMKIKNGLRGVDPAMQTVIQSLSLEQLEKTVNYASYFIVPKSDAAESRSWRNPDFK